MRPIYVFAVAQVPVFISPWFLLLLVFFGTGKGATAQSFVLLASCVTVSLLVHEFGHAMTARRFGLGPTVLLHGFGGLCAHRPAARDRDDALIVAAGPGAGLLLFLACLGVQQALMIWQPALLAERTVLANALKLMVWINLFWSLANLIPLWPLDGGQLFRLGILRMVGPDTARTIVHGVGIALAAVIAALVLYVFGKGGLFMALVLGFLGFQNLQALKASGGGQVVRRNHKSKKLRLMEAFEAYDREDFEEAARICHQVRMDSDLPPEVLDSLWPLLGLATAHKGEPEEALQWLRRAKMGPQVAQAMIVCLTQLGRQAEARELVESPELETLSDRVRRQLLDRIETSG